MKQMVNPGEENCPFEFNFDESTFKPGDMISYRVTGSLAEMPFVGILLEVHEDHVILAHDDGNRPPKGITMRGTRESRPVVEEEEALR
ncbi:MAG: hypothetical protein MI808_12990 [Pseudomonadales bacterium]|nr:hypothetical protein [Pseudomonadales bacterium]